MNNLDLMVKEYWGFAEDLFPVLASLIAQKFSGSQVEVWGPNIVSDWFQAENFNAIRNRCYFNKPKNHHIEILSHMIDNVEALVISCKNKAKILVPGKTFR